MAGILQRQGKRTGDGKDLMTALRSHIVSLLNSYVFQPIHLDEPAMECMNTHKKLSLHGYKRLLPILTLIIINLIIGAGTFQSYGESADEPSMRDYAGQSLDAYKSWIMPSYSPDSGGDKLLPYYGPAFVMGVELCVRLFGFFPSSVLATDIWHLAYFLSFQLAILCIYLLGRRWMSNWAAFGVTLLFSTQPLLWGHAFINPKDIPFMTFFLASIVTGLWMCERVVAASERETAGLSYLKALIIQSLQNWRNSPRRSKKAALIISLAWLLSIVILIVGAGALNGYIAAAVKNGYFADPLSLVGHLFAKFALHANNIPVEIYIQKAQTLFGYMRNGYFVFGAILIIWLYRSAFPWKIGLPSKREILSFSRQFVLSFTQPAVIIAGIVLGLTTSIRVLGPLAGLIVALYAFKAIGKKILAPLLAYAVIALIAMYLTWPYLWSAPFSHLLESVTTMSAFPWLGRVLFNGNYYPPGDLPRSFLPILLSIQFTEPVIILFGIGCILAVYNFVNLKHFELFGISLIWFFIPISILIITRRPIYDNFRQLLFLLPPIFLLCGIALDGIFHFVRKGNIRILIIVLLISPGVYGILSLHPYEYIYYNSFMGGVEGAFRRYETDYWMTSFREAAEYLNKTAEQNSKIVGWGGYRLVKQYTRPDLIVEPERVNTYALTGGYNYAVLSSRGGNDDVYPDEAPIFSVRRGNAILAVVKHLSPSSSPWEP